MPSSLNPYRYRSLYWKLARAHQAGKFPPEGFAWQIEGKVNKHTAKNIANEWNFFVRALEHHGDPLHTSAAEICATNSGKFSDHIRFMLRDRAGDSGAAKLEAALDEVIAGATASAERHKKLQENPPSISSVLGKLGYGEE